jgi:hypothetical protein
MLGKAFKIMQNTFEKNQAKKRKEAHASIKKVGDGFDLLVEQTIMDSLVVKEIEEKGQQYVNLPGATVEAYFFNAFRNLGEKFDQTDMDWFLWYIKKRCKKLGLRLIIAHRSRTAHYSSEADESVYTYDVTPSQSIFQQVVSALKAFVAKKKAC